MKAIVVPERYQEQVDQVLHDVFVGGHVGGTENLTFSVMRHMMPRCWSVRASGLGDPVLEASYSDMVRDALDRSLPCE